LVFAIIVLPWPCWGHYVHPMAPSIIYITQLYKVFYLNKKEN